MQIKSVINLALTVGVVISSSKFPNGFLSGPVDRIDRPPSGTNIQTSGFDESLLDRLI